MNFQVVSFNIAGVNYNWFGQRREVVLTALAMLKPDILCLQEVAILHPHNYDQCADLSKELSLPYWAYNAYGRKDETLPDERDGIAILSRYPIIGSHTFKLPSLSPRDDTERSMIMAEIEMEGVRIDILNTHLSWPMDDGELRKMQCQAILDISSSISSSPKILAGDFNESSEEWGIQLISKFYKDALQEGNTWSHQNTLTQIYTREEGKIDYIFYDKHFMLMNSELIFNQPSPIFASDHFGVRAEFKFL